MITFAIGSLGCGICCAFYPIVTNYWIMMSLILVNGFCMSAYNCMVPVAALQMFGIRHINFATGTYWGFYGIGSYLGPPLIGFLFEAFHHDYIKTMMVASVAFGFGFLIAICSYFLDRRREQTDF